MNKLIFTLMCLSLSACAIGPLVSHETARTVGDANHELVAGYGVAGMVYKWNYGLNDNFDVGLHLESLSLGVRFKYAFINNQSNGWSLAAALGTGSSFGGSHKYADLMLSYLGGSWEPYATARFVDVQTDPVEFRDENTGEVDFRVNRNNYQYGTAILGSRYWFNKHWLFSLEAAKLFAVNSSLSIESDFMAGAALGYRF